MALGDYILCCKCEVKLIYDGDRSQREWWEERFGKPPQIECPDCKPKREPLTWQSIETAPRDSKARLVWCPDRQNTYAATRYKDKWCIFGGGVLHEVPTHWMPLPTPPIEAAHGIKREA